MWCTLYTDAPWCVHCQRLGPVWRQLADLYAHSDDVIVAQIDVTANDVTGVEINAFPTIRMYGNDGHTVSRMLTVVAVTMCIGMEIPREREYYQNLIINLPRWK